MTDEEILKRAAEIETRNNRLQKLERALKAEKLSIAFGDLRSFSFDRMETVNVSRFMLETAIKAEIARLKG